MPTILSRFDMIFIVKDEHDQQKDMVGATIEILLFFIYFFTQTLAKHIISVHMNADRSNQENKDGELSLELIKKYIHYCRTYVINLLISIF